MKIAILTQPLGHNYGGLLQAYALQTYLKNIGFDVETLDRRRSPTIGIIIKSHIKNIIKIMLGRIKCIPTLSRQALVFEKLIEFRDHKLVMSPTITSELEIRDYFRTHQFDVVIVGSDQVWRPKYSPSILNFYLDFLEDIHSPAKRLAYAASFGVDNWEYTDVVGDECKVLAKQFNAISVREESAIELCETKLDVSANWVVDPTLLLEPAEYDLLIEECAENENKDCVLSYVLDPDPEKHSIADIVGDTLNTNVFSIKPEQLLTQVKSCDIGQSSFPSVESWLQAFRDAKFVVTDSFHGTVFSILFNKPFIAIENSARGAARFESLLSQFGLKERLIKTKDEITPVLIEGEIDWKEINFIRTNLADDSRRFIKNNLLGVAT
nr:polysaccharide pyruvyl transferase family protein [uncultured Amphritea sp.]